MDFVFYFVFFCMSWWIILFIILPIGVVTAKKPEKGHADSAPLNPRIGIKFLATTIIAVLITAILAYFVEIQNFNLDFLKN